MTDVVDLLSWGCLGLGGFIMLVAAIGMIRLPDFYTRLHAASLADTGGALLMLLGLGLQTGFDLITFKLFLIAAILFFTTPTASHAVAHSALLGGLSPDNPAENQKESADGDAQSR